MGHSTNEPFSQLNQIGIKEIFDCDPRPTFILDLDIGNLGTDLSQANKLSIIFCNGALQSHHVLYELITGTSDSDNNDHSGDTHPAGFRTWAASISKLDDSYEVCPSTFIYNDMLWTASTVRKKWRVISGIKRDLPDSIPARSGGLDKPRATASPPSIDPPQSSVISPSNSGAHSAHRINGDYQVGSNSAPSLQRDRIQVEHIEPKEPISTKPDQQPEHALSPALPAPEGGTYDWTIPEPQGELSEHMKFARSIDWGSTALGVMSQWSRELRQMANLVMSNGHPAALFWGPDLTMLYNQAYRDEVAGTKHPAMMGTGGRGPYKEVWDQLGPLFAECARSGKCIRNENACFFIERYGMLEEVYFSYSIAPLYAGQSEILGFYNSPFDTTRDCLSHRRMLTLQRLSNTISEARTVKQFWKQILLGLESNHRDVPFALLYSIVNADECDNESSSSGSFMNSKSCMLEGSIAVPTGHPAVPTRLDLRQSKEGFIPSFREAMRTREPTRLLVKDGSLPERLLQGIEWRGFGEACKEAVIFPLRPTNGDSVLAFLLIGVNPRRRFDEDYQAFANLLNRQLATALASVLLFEEEMRKAEHAIVAANLQQQQLNEQLALETNRLQRMTALSPLGMFYLSPEGLILEANERYYEMTMHDRNDHREMGWMDQLVESSKATMLDGWHKLTVDMVPWTAELQLNMKRPEERDSILGSIEYWVLTSSQPEFGLDGKLRSVMGCITDISNYKWAQGLQERRLREAEERRRQQNEFIDITSHEMRNPLSAILQCADDITSTLTAYRACCNDPADASLIASCIESANTIALCVQHQKTIVDDILTVSKLDSNLLELAPMPSQPVVVTRSVLKMFESELIAKKINFSFIVSPDCEELGIDWVSMDPSRVSQILINLLTNAIKFTSDRQHKDIKVYIGASTKPPSVTNTRDFHYIPKRAAPKSPAITSNSSKTDTIFIRIKVADTGCGLSPKEMRLLFQRFQQANPRTHAQYGGSGLGLFISRQLTELHGGQIGVASAAGEGSTFGFYIQTRRLPPPERHSISSFPANSHLTDPPNNHRPDTPDLITSHIEKEMHASDAIGIDINSSASLQVHSSSPTPLHILVVEDNLVNQRVLKRQLQKAGSTVFVADNGQRALEFLKTCDFCVEGGQQLSVVLMDLEMPVMDGLTCVRNIRQLEQDDIIRRHIPVIAVTANVRLEQVLSARAAGMDDIVSKPFRIPELIAKIDLLLGRTDIGD
ncbi:hypothetical protein R6Q59_010214 [Mikania micrantha]